MADKLTNKAEFIDEMMDSLRIAGFSDPDERLEWAERIWSRLVRRGLAEEQREPGDYHVKWKDNHLSWEPARLTKSGAWVMLGTGSQQYIPAIIGPRIDPPKD